MRRPRLQWPMILTLAVAWVLFWGDLSLANLLSGAFLGLLIAVVFPLPPVEFIGRFRFLAPLRLMVRLLADLVVSSITVAGQALRFGRPIRNAIVRVDLRTHSDLYLTLTSELVSLVPGTLVVEARRRESVLYVHVLDVRSPADVDRAHRGALDAEARVLRAFGSAAEVAALDAEQDAERGAR